ncbi:hypothetical protein Poli38472_008163 [Pythium oligandrum]|uniref:Elongation factor Tu, chloroplastic n=1 Tax=Pythium oligandrum TaxID=41045 RepID=A0A8K1FK12_PYTOL|nr:hypothetical protein Poli38472_008163 [Pythium oligandrum]|eukprot:TMW65521.1 hypothetical protein Poli38472_008163 [Pythium oligandrum]
MDRIRELCRQVQGEYKRRPSKNEDVVASTDLPQEVEEGNVEYKLQLLDPAPDRVKHLTTQLHWRLNEGKGEAFYEIGVRDNGEAIGIPLPSMIKSMRTLARMCQVLNASLEIVCFRQGHEPALRAVRVRVTRIVDKKAKKQLRVSVIGDFESGKSTLIGVLTRGCLDDGCGLARMQVFRHRHEIENGCTSSISEHTIGVTEDGGFCTVDSYDDCDLRDSDEPAEVKSLITFSDLAGHKKYFKVTASGLASQFPDYAMLLVDSTKGVQSMTIEHIKIAIALEVSVVVVLTKVDNATTERIAETILQVQELLKSLAPGQTVRLIQDGTEDVSAREIPLVLVSSVTGEGVPKLQSLLASLLPKRIWSTQSATAAEFQINKAYDHEDEGTIVTGLVQSGTIVVGEHLLLGPDSQGQFSEIVVNSIEVQRKAERSLAAGETGALLISRTSTNEEPMAASYIRKGMMLIHPSVEPMATLQFDAEVHFLQDLSLLKENCQAVVHAGRIRQMAKVVRVEPQGHSPRALCRFEFMYWPEYMRPDIPVVLREASAYAVGKVVRAVHLTNEHTPTTVRTF